MNTKQVLYYTLLILLFAVSSCAPSYIPSSVNTPMLNNKGEVQLTAHAALSGFNPQIAYAVTDNIGVMVNGCFADSESERDDDDYYKHNMVELGAGYYKRFSDLVKFEAYGGVGYGELESNDDDYIFTPNISVVNKKLFIQPAMGVTSSIFDIGFATRFTFLHMEQDVHSEYAAFFEPVTTIKLGYKNVKMLTQFGYSVPFKEEIDFGYHPFIFSFGLQLNFGRKYDSQFD